MGRQQGVLIWGETENAPFALKIKNMEYDTIKNRTLRATNNSVFLLLQIWAETKRKERNQKVKRKTVSRNKDVGGQQDDSASGSVCCQA